KQRGERDDAAHPPLEAGPRPHLAPGVAGDEILEVGGESALVLLGTVDVRAAEDLAAHGHTRVAAAGVCGFRPDGRIAGLLLLCHPCSPWGIWSGSVCCDDDEYRASARSVNAPAAPV